MTYLIVLATFATIHLRGDFGANGVAILSPHPRVLARGIEIIAWSKIVVSPIPFP